MAQLVFLTHTDCPVIHNHNVVLMFLVALRLCLLLPMFLRLYLYQGIVSILAFLGNGREIGPFEVSARSISQPAGETRSVETRFWLFRFQISCEILSEGNGLPPFKNQHQSNSCAWRLEHYCGLCLYAKSTHLQIVLARLRPSRKRSDLLSLD